MAGDGAAGTVPKKPAHDFAQQYDADKVFGKYWIPWLAALEERIN